MPRPILDIAAMRPILEDALGSNPGLAGVERLTGGTKKGVHRLEFEDGSSMVLYVWQSDEDFWPDRDEDPADPFSHASSSELFEAGNRLLCGLGVATPKIIYLDRVGMVIDGDFALVEDVRGSSLAQLLESDPPAADQPMSELRAALEIMGQAFSRHLGKVPAASNQSNKPAVGVRTPQQIVLERAVADLDAAADQIGELLCRKSAIEHLLSEATSRIAPRQEFSLIHGELGPDHVLVDANGRAFLIDIEGLMYFDAEWEHAFLKIRFDRHYDKLEVDTLDPHRMALYELALHLSLITGPLRLLGTDFPDRGLMQRIVDWNLRRLIELTDR